MLNGEQGVGPGDRFIAGALRGAGVPVVVAVNKVDRLDLDAVDLVDRDDDRHLGLAQRAGDEAVARSDALLGVEHQQRGVGVAQLALDARSACAG